MDKDQAKFILESYRPDGADAQDETFAEALALAAQDRELGDWLAEQRAYDAHFAAALANIEIPESLRDEIFAMLAGASTEPQVDELDGQFIGAFAQMTPPPGLRDQIIAAMEVQEKITPFPQRKIATGLRWLTVAAAAAVVVFSAILAFKPSDPDPSSNSSLAQIPARDFMQAGRVFLASSFKPDELDSHDKNPAKLYQWLESHDAFSPNDIPKALTQSTSIGCKVLTIAGVKASLVCYRLSDGQVVHIITVNRKDISGDLKSFAEASLICESCPHHQWAMTHWADEEKAHFAFTQMLTPTELSEVF